MRPRPPHAEASAETGVSRAGCIGGHATIRPHALPCRRGRPGRCRSPPHHRRDDLAARGTRRVRRPHRFGRRPVQHLERGVGGAHARGGSAGPLQRQHLLPPPRHARILRGQHRRRRAGRAVLLGERRQPVRRAQRGGVPRLRARAHGNLQPRPASDGPSRWRRGRGGLVRVLSVRALAHPAHSTADDGGHSLLAARAAPLRRHADGRPRVGARPGARGASALVRLLRHLRGPARRVRHGVLRRVARPLAPLALLGRRRPRRRAVDRDRAALLLAVHRAAAGGRLRPVPRRLAALVRRLALVRRVGGAGAPLGAAVPRPVG